MIRKLSSVFVLAHSGLGLCSYKKFVMKVNDNNITLTVRKSTNICANKALCISKMNYVGNHKAISEKPYETINDINYCGRLHLCIVLGTFQ